MMLPWAAWQLPRIVAHVMRDDMRITRGDCAGHAHIVAYMCTRRCACIHAPICAYTRRLAWHDTYVSCHDMTRIFIRCRASHGRITLFKVRSTLIQVLRTWINLKRHNQAQISHNFKFHTKSEFYTKSKFSSHFKISQFLRISKFLTFIAAATRQLMWCGPPKAGTRVNIRACTHTCTHVHARARTFPKILEIHDIIEKPKKSPRNATKIKKFLQ